MTRKREILKHIYLYSALAVQIFALQAALSEALGLSPWACLLAETILILVGSPTIGFAMAAAAFITIVETWNLPVWIALPIAFPALTIAATQCIHRLILRPKSIKRIYR